MAYFRDLREFVAELDRVGKLWRISDPFNKDTDLVPFFRLQQRGLPPQQRRAILFEQPVGASGRHYAMSVLAGVYGASREIHLLGMQCASPAELQERWHRALSNPIEPVIVESGPVHEEVHTDRELEEAGLEALPVPLEEVGYSCMIRTGTPMVTRNPTTGVRNAGCYNAFFQSRTTMHPGLNSSREAYHLWRAAGEAGQPFPVAVVVGPTPNFMAVGAAPLPPDMDEYAVAGGLVGEPLQLVRCKTVPLEVPATAEIVIEGWLDPNIVEPRAPFGEYPGYIEGDWGEYPLMRVSAITHRANAMFTPITVGFPPSDTNVVWGDAQAGVLYHQLRSQGLPVLEVYHPEATGGSDITVLRLANGTREHAWKALDAASNLKESKWFITVDEDVDPTDPGLLWWALTYNVHRLGDEIRILEGRRGALDPSAHPPYGSTDAGQWADQERRGDTGKRLQKVLINAMRPWPYPPLALPAKGYMERALEIWDERPDAPPLTLQPPWYGYELGHWPEQYRELARIMIDGDFTRAGEILAAGQRRIR